MTNLPCIDGGWPVIAADPPWLYRSNSAAAPGRNAIKHYPCMTLSEIEAMPVRAIIAPNALLALWITGPFLAIGAHLPIMRAWGFKPSTIGFTWGKLNKRAPGLFHTREDYFMGTGLTTRKNAEFVVFGKRGRSLRKSKSVRELIVSPVRAHSRKPDEFYERIEAYCDGPYLELFARQSRPGWQSWGNDVNHFD